MSTDIRLPLEFVPSNWAVQHLNAGVCCVTLCGKAEGDPRLKGTVTFDHTEGFNLSGEPACQQCADIADRMQNG